MRVQVRLGVTLPPPTNAWELGYSGMGMRLEYHFDRALRVLAAEVSRVATGTM